MGVKQQESPLIKSGFCLKMRKTLHVIVERANKTVRESKIEKVRILRKKGGVVAGSIS